MSSQRALPKTRTTHKDNDDNTRSNDKPQDEQSRGRLIFFKNILSKILKNIFKKNHSRSRGNRPGLFGDKGLCPSWAALLARAPAVVEGCRRGLPLWRTAGVEDRWHGGCSTGGIGELQAARGCRRGGRRLLWGRWRATKRRLLARAKTAAVGALASYALWKRQAGI